MTLLDCARACSAQAFTILVVAYLVERVAAQAPGNDIIAWPPGLLLLATIIYAALSKPGQQLWYTDPIVGLFHLHGRAFWTPGVLYRCKWQSRKCHFMPLPRKILTTDALWIPSSSVLAPVPYILVLPGPLTWPAVFTFWWRSLLEQAQYYVGLGQAAPAPNAQLPLPPANAGPQPIPPNPPLHVANPPAPAQLAVVQQAPDGALRGLENAIPCVHYTSDEVLDGTGWAVGPHRFLRLENRVVRPSHLPRVAARVPTAKDYLLFASVGFCEPNAAPRPITVRARGQAIFSTHYYPAGGIFDVTDIEMTRVVVGALVAGYDRLGNLGVQIDEWMLHDGVPYVAQVTLPGAADPIPVRTTLGEVIMAYLSVVEQIRHLRQLSTVPPRTFAQVHVNGACWIALLGGHFLQEGRLTIYQVPDDRELYDPADSPALYTRLVTQVADTLRDARLTASAFDKLTSAEGVLPSRTRPFLIAGICCQVAVCFFLAVGTSAGIWTSVAIANALTIGRFHDLHPTTYNRRTGGYDPANQPGYKLFTRRTRRLRAVVTTKFTTPPHGPLRPGLLLNLAGIVAAICGSITPIQTDVRRALDFGDFRTSPRWVLWTTVGISLAVSLSLILAWITRYMAALAGDRRETPAEAWEVTFLVGSTVVGSFAVCGLALFFERTKRGYLWPIIDTLVFLSGIPLGLIGNGKMPHGHSYEDVVLQLLLLNRWVMGAVASSLGSGVKA